MSGWTQEELEEIREHRSDALAFLDRAGATVPRIPRLERRVRAGCVPLSFAQEQLWLQEQLSPGGTEYNVPLSVRVRGPLDVAAMCASLEEVVRRHESLRTRFEWQGEAPVQLIEAPGSFRVELVDWSALAPAPVLAKVDELCAKEASWRFDLARGPLIRACLARLELDQHFLCVTLHHIVADGWSIGILTRELGELYRAYSRGQRSPLPELPLQYADFALWQRQWLQGAALERQMAFWRRQLQGMPSVLELPADRRRTPVASHAGATLPVSLGQETSQRIRQLCRREGVTTYIVLLAAFKLLLSRYSGQSEVLVGAPVAGRTHPDTEPLIGFFVNVLVLGTRLSERWTVRELLQQVKQVALDAYTHQDLPFEKLVAELRVERMPARKPLCQVMLVMHNTPGDSLELPGFELQSVASGASTSKFDLTLLLGEAKDDICGHLEYSTDLFDRWRMERLIQHFQRLVGQLAADPARALWQLQLTDSIEREQLRHWNDMAAERRVHEPVHRLIAAQAGRTPDAVAVIFEHCHLTYAQLEARANQLSRHLRMHGVEPGDRVGICMERSLEMMIGLLGILKTGAAYVPLDPDYPTERLDCMLQDAAPRMLLVQEHTRSRVSAAASIVALDSQWSAIHKQQCTPPEAGVGTSPAGALAYIIYTSGSTGRPKGVMVEHAGLSNYLQFAVSKYITRPGAATAVIGSISFDATVTSLYTPLLCGGSVVLVRQGQELEGLEQLLRSSREWSFIKISPGHLQSLGQRLCGKTAICRVGAFVIGGEALPPGVARLWRSLWPEARLINEYGPTETVVGCTYHEVSAADCEDTSVPVGRPIANMRVCILDTHGQPVPVGVVGEIHIGGVGVVRGYLNQPALTAQCFVADGAGAGRLYRSGDLGRLRRDGSLEYVGRSDQQIKLRGYRIDPSEIEAQLMKHPRVAEAVVVARRNPAGDLRLVAYLVPPGVVAPEARELYAQLQQSLPAHMVPAAFVTLKGLPRTVNGKIDRTRLPEPSLDSHLASHYEAPRGELENTLAHIWCEALGLERMGRNDHFFELGGHSLLAFTVISRVNPLMGCTLAAADVYRFPTIEQLASRIRSGATDAELIDLAAEGLLESSITVGNSPVAQAGEHGPKATMLTGCTGFIGRFLLAQLLESTDVTLYCLVRAGGADDALGKLRATLRCWDLWNEALAARIVALPGDLSLPRLGLDEPLYESVRQNVDTIYHVASSVNFLETYAMASRVNVAGVRELLRLAATGPAKLINYISTLGVFSPIGVAGERVVNEETSTGQERHLASRGYEASKWVAENLLLQAGARGFACNLFRLGLICADTRQGRYDERQWGYRLIKSCLLSGYGITSYEYDPAPIPVDYVARALAYLGGKHRGGGSIFHLAGHGNALGGLFESCRELIDTPLELMAYSEWVDAVSVSRRAGRALPIGPLIGSGLATAVAGRIRFDCSRTREELAAANLPVPEFNRQLLRMLLENMLSRDPELRGALSA